VPGAVRLSFPKRNNYRTKERIFLAKVYEQDASACHCLFKVKIFEDIKLAFYEHSKIVFAST